MTWTVYIVENRLGQYYAGICTDLTRRFAEHSKGGQRCAKALKGKGPLTLKFAAEVSDHTSALQAEMWIKKQRRGDKQKLIDGTLSLIHEHAALTKNHLDKIMINALAKL